MVGKRLCDVGLTSGWLRDIKSSAVKEVRGRAS